MIKQSNAKINLGLNITNKRADGFHELESIFLPIPIYDIISIEKAKELSFSSEGISIPGESSSNLCLKAFELIREKRDIPNVKIHLNKMVPIGAGLGGGSSNGAFVLKMLDEIFELNFSILELELMAMELGSDCAFFIKNKPCFVTGRGEILDFNLELTIKGYMILVNPGIHISTKEAYSLIEPNYSIFDLRKISSIPIIEWTGIVKNDFEAPMLRKHEELKDLKNQLINSGANYVSMTGSGSSFFAIYSTEPETLIFPKNYYSKEFKITI